MEGREWVGGSGLVHWNNWSDWEGGEGGPEGCLQWKGESGLVRVK